MFLGAAAIMFMFSYFTVEKYEHCAEIDFKTEYCENILKPEYNYIVEGE